MTLLLHYINTYFEAVAFVRLHDVVLVTETR